MGGLVNVHRERCVCTTSLFQSISLLILFCTDGKNLDQLLHYANLPDYLTLFRQRYLMPTSPPFALPSSSKHRILPSDSPTLALALWIHWYVFDYTGLGRDQKEVDSTDVLYMLRLYVFAAQLVCSLFFHPSHGDIR